MALATRAGSANGRRVRGRRRLRDALRGEPTSLPHPSIPPTSRAVHRNPHLASGHSDGSCRARSASRFFGMMASHRWMSIPPEGVAPLSRGAAQRPLWAQGVWGVGRQGRWKVSSPVGRQKPGVGGRFRRVLEDAKGGVGRRWKALEAKCAALEGVGRSSIRLRQGQSDDGGARAIRPHAPRFSASRTAGPWPASG